MKRFFKFIPLFSFSILAFSCEPELDEVVPSTGDLDFTHYVAFGDYITAGYTNGAITRQSQESSYPAILNRQFSLSEANTVFEQPYIGSLGNQPKLTVTGYDAQGLPLIGGLTEMYKFILTGCAADAYEIYEKYTGIAPENLQNLGIPGLKIRQVALAGLGNAANNAAPVGINPPKFNPYFERILPAGDNRSYAQIAGRSKPSFFSLWIGMADIMTYALSGGTCNSMPTQVASSPNPNSRQFQVNFFTLLDSISANGTRTGVVCTLPALKDLPFANGLNPVTYQQKLRDTRNDQTLTIWVSRPLNIFNPNAGTEVVPVSFEDVLLKSGLEKLRNETAGLSQANPLSNEDVLNSNEIAQFVEPNIGYYNDAIKSVATNPKYKDRIAVVNMDVLFSTNGIRNGVIFNGVTYSSTPVTGGIFSLDNFTLTPRGQAIAANRIIQRINQFFKVEISEVDVNSFPIL